MHDRRTARRSPWRRLRRATRGPRNAVLAGGIAACAWLIGRLPVAMGLAVGRGLGMIAWRVLGTPRRLADAHCAAAMPERAADARRIVRDTFRHAGMAFAEIGLVRKLMHRPGYVLIDGLDALEAEFAKGRGVIAASGHVGNWELLAAVLAQRGIPLTVVARRVNDARFDALVVRFRRAAGAEVLGRDDPHFMSAMRDALDRNRLVALLIDQDMRGAGVFVPFFGRLARTPPGAAMLALRARAPVMTVFIARRPDGGHRVTFRSVRYDDLTGRDRIITLTARLTAAIEAQIRETPAEWVWWHERWRSTPTAAEASRVAPSPVAW